VTCVATPSFGTSRCRLPPMSDRDCIANSVDDAAIENIYRTPVLTMSCELAPRTAYENAETASVSRSRRLQRQIT